MRVILLTFLVILLCMTAFAQDKFPIAYEPSPIDKYSIHDDGGIIYDPQRREAEKTGQLKKYLNAATTAGVIETADYKLEYKVPKEVTAYDAVPIKYRLVWKNAKMPDLPVAVEATAFEEKERLQNENVYDLALPGKLDLKVEYLGSITAHYRPGGRNILKPDMSDEPAESYPDYDRKPFTSSQITEAGDAVWFKFRYTNTGNTILDIEGLGGWFIRPQLLRKDAQGEYQLCGEAYNLYLRDLKYLYPGESHEIWLTFQTTPAVIPTNYSIPEGEYLIKFVSYYRDEYDHNWLRNIWDGSIFHIYEQEVTVEKSPRQLPIKSGKVTFSNANKVDKITRWIHTFEEFMTSFDNYITKPKGKTAVNGTLHLQVAPWTEDIVIKLINSPNTIKTALVPVKTDTDSLNIAYNPNNKNNLVKDGMKEPIIFTQSMADMRWNMQITPFPEQTLREDIRTLKNCGINLFCGTSMPWLYDICYGNPELSYNTNADAWKYWLDLARDENMQMEGWGNYPFARIQIGDIASWMTGTDMMLSNAFWAEASLSDPKLPAANATAWEYQRKRWGDLWYTREDNSVPISVEDSRGWMRIDLNIRYPMGDLVVKDFQDWTKNKYGTIEAVNEAWNSDFTSFEEIQPEKNQVRNPFGHEWEYTNPENLFHDWSVATEDFDTFRTDLRVKNYRETLKLMEPTLPNAKIAIRTEGSNVLIDGTDPKDMSPHMRHIFFSQRRCGLIAKPIQESGTVAVHSDYTTIPYTPTELKELTQKCVDQGIIPSYLPGFENMRDIAINDKYGENYKIHYNIDKDTYGTMMHQVTALYPWFVATYEGGGIPGVLWGDLQCDGIVTETQIKELKFFKEKLDKALNTPSAIEDRKKIVDIDTSWKKDITPKNSFERLYK